MNERDGDAEPDLASSDGVIGQGEAANAAVVGLEEKDGQHGNSLEQFEQDSNYKEERETTLKNEYAESRV